MMRKKKIHFKTICLIVESTPINQNPSCFYHFCVCNGKLSSNSVVVTLRVMIMTGNRFVPGNHLPFAEFAFVCGEHTTVKFLIKLWNLNIVV